jgi:uracil-DNA glycosylase
MAERIPETLYKKLSERLHFYEDLGVRLFYKDRGAPHALSIATPAAESFEALLSQPISSEAVALPKSIRNPELSKATQPASRALPTQVAQTAPRVTYQPEPLPVPAAPSLFEAFGKVPDDTLLKIRTDLGECTRCKLHTTRNKIVFGDGSPKAICNVVKCRPPENRAPEKDEVEQCSPFLLRQIDAIAPKVIVCLGSTAAQTVLETNRGISQFRGQWLEFRGRKLMATYHPAYLLRNPSAKSEVWKDLQKVMAVLGLEVKKGKSAEAGKSS